MSATLWLGGEDVVGNPAFYAQHNIRAVLSVCDTRPPPGIALAKRLHISIPDSPSADLKQHFEAIVEFLHDAELQGAAAVVCGRGTGRGAADSRFPQAT